MNEQKIFEFLNKIEAEAKEAGIENLFVIAENHSITRNNGNEAIKRCREALKKYEKEIGSNPEEDWRDR